MELTLHKIFDDAYAVLEPENVALIKGSYGSAERGGFCATGALRQAVFGDTVIPDSFYESGGRMTPIGKLYDQAYSRLSSKVVRVSDGHLFTIPAWNDRPECTKADVLALFRELAAEAAAQTEAAA